MDPFIVGNLLKGPPAELDAALPWLQKIHQACASSSDAQMKALAVPLRSALELVTGVERVTEGTLQDEVHGFILVARVKLIYAFADELQKFHVLLSAESARLPPGHPQRRTWEELKSTYEQTLNALARAYESIREGKIEALEEARSLLLKAGELASRLRQ
jgi:hypothetical protein